MRIIGAVCSSLPSSKITASSYSLATASIHSFRCFLEPVAACCLFELVAIFVGGSTSFDYRSKMRSDRINVQVVNADDAGREAKDSAVGP